MRRCYAADVATPYKQDVRRAKIGFAVMACFIALSGFGWWKLYPRGPWLLCMAFTVLGVLTFIIVGIAYWRFYLNDDYLKRV